MLSPEGPAYSAPNVGPLLAMWERLIVLALPIVQPLFPADRSPVPDCAAPKVTPVLMTVPRSIVLLDPAISCDIAPELLSIWWVNHSRRRDLCVCVCVLNNAIGFDS